MRILAGKVVVGDGKTVLTDARITIQGGVIADVSHGDAPHDADSIYGGEIVDLSDATILPGLIDLHVHFARTRAEDAYTRALERFELRLLRSTIDCKALLDAGFTTVRSAGGMDAIFLRDAIREGIIPGPTIYAAGRAITQTGGHGDVHFVPKEWLKGDRIRFGRIADGVAQCREAVRDQLREGADFIKVMTAGGVASQKDHPRHAQYSMEELQAIVEEAKRNDMHVAAHAGGAGITTAIQAGCATIEHGYFLESDQIDLMLRHDVTYVPTLLRLYLGVHVGPEAGQSEWLSRKFREGWQNHREAVHLAHERGVKIGVGTDLGLRPHTRHGTNAQELDLLVQCGMSNLEAIAAATSIASEAMGLADHVGTVEIGKAADLIAVNSDPLSDIRELMSVDFVMKDGVVWKS
ncbi:amidohydrolase family protein [Chloroflexota bacterium]